MQSVCGLVQALDRDGDDVMENEIVEESMCVSVRFWFCSTQERCFSVSVYLSAHHDKSRGTERHHCDPDTAFRSCSDAHEWQGTAHRHWSRCRPCRSNGRVCHSLSAWKYNSSILFRQRVVANREDRLQRLYCWYAKCACIVDHHPERAKRYRRPGKRHCGPVIGDCGSGNDDARWSCCNGLAGDCVDGCGTRGGEGYGAGADD